MKIVIGFVLASLSAPVAATSTFRPPARRLFRARSSCGR